MFRLSVVVILSGVAVSGATVTGGGGRAASDCLSVFDAAINIPLTVPRHVDCVDGDPSCDMDAQVNGLCEIALSVCANSSFDARCTLQGVQSIRVWYAEDNGDPNFDPDFQALQTRIDNDIAPPSDVADACTLPTAVSVAIRGPIGNNVCSKGRKKVRVTTTSRLIGGQIYSDVDRIRLTCVPSPNDGCNPQTLFAGTFDRIQRQIFQQSCALSGCHDSQSVAGALLLETGAAYGNLLGADPLTGVVPANGAAAAAGWKRVTVTDVSSGDPNTSFLYRKVVGGLDDSYGERMPYGRRALPSSLRAVIQLWIQNGAPQAGWVPGTF